MNYNRLKFLCKEKKVPLSKLATDLDFTEPGFYAMIKNDTMKIKTLERIAEIKQQKTRLINCRAAVDEFLIAT